MAVTHMTETADPMFRCDVCGRRHKWTPELAGTTITCQCLEPVSVPDQPESDLYDMAPVPVEPIRPVAPAASYDDSSAVLAYQRPLDVGVDEQYSEANPLIVSVAKDLVIPITLIVIGTVVEFAASLHFGASPAGAAASVGFDFVIDVGLMLVGVVVAARLLAVSFGPVPTAILKLGGIAIGPAGLTTVIVWALGGGPIFHFLGWIAAMGLAVWLLWYLFDLDPSEVWITAVIVYGMRVAAWTILSIIVR